MTFHAVVPAPFTILRGIRKLPPATVRVIEPDGRSRDARYWRLQYGTRAEERDLTYEDWQGLTLDALRTAVERRLVADVPVGVLLSGGLDSSLIVGLLAEQGQRGLNTFSVGFESVGDELGDEFQYSDIIARHYGTEHHKIRGDVSSRGFRQTKQRLARIPARGRLHPAPHGDDRVGVRAALGQVGGGAGADHLRRPRDRLRRSCPVPRRAGGVHLALCPHRRDS